MAILERVVSVERVHQRAAKTGGFSVPVMHERLVDDPSSLLLVTNTKGHFVQTRPSKNGFARFAFFELPVEGEDCIFLPLWETMVRCVRVNGWSNRASSVQEALNVMAQGVHAPQTVLYSDQDEPPATSLSTFPINFPRGAALVFSDPSLGYCVRTGDYMGLLLQGVDSRFMVVG